MLHAPTQVLLLQLTSVLAAQCAAVAHIQRMTAGSGWDLQAQADAQAALQLRYGLNSDAQQQLALKTGYAQNIIDILGALCGFTPL